MRSEKELIDYCLYGAFICLAGLFVCFPFAEYFYERGRLKQACLIFLRTKDFKYVVYRCDKVLDAEEKKEVLEFEKGNIGR